MSLTRLCAILVKSNVLLTGADLCARPVERRVRRISRPRCYLPLCYLPLKDGLVFSRKDFVPSRKSSVEATKPK
jgi:hypothetical protein